MTLQPPATGESIPSLLSIIEEVNDFSLYGLDWSDGQMKKNAEWITSQYQPSNHYLGFSLTTQEQNEFRLFSGERLRTRIGSLSVLGLEACRALLLIDAYNSKVQQVLQQVNRRLETACFANGCILGECAHASLAVIRYLAVRRLDGDEARLMAGVENLRTRRDGSGRWKGFPYYYSLLALNEISNLSRLDMLYAASSCEKLLRQNHGEGLVAQRRKRILENFMEKL